MSEWRGLVNERKCEWTDHRQIGRDPCSSLSENINLISRINFQYNMKDPPLGVNE